MGRNWTGAEIDDIKTRWESGESASIIGNAYDVTRNTIMGKINRLGLHRSSTGQKAAQAHKIRSVRPRYTHTPAPTQTLKLKSPEPRRDVQPVVPVEIVIPVGQRKTLITINLGECHWPVGNPGTPDFYYCGASADEGQSYCAAHRRVCYAPRPKRTAAPPPDFKLKPGAHTFHF